MPWDKGGENELSLNSVEWAELSEDDREKTPEGRVIKWRERLKEAARRVRTCKLQEGGYMIHETTGKRSYYGHCRCGVFNYADDKYDSVIDCRCRKYWKGCYRRLIEAHDAYRKVSDSDYPELLTLDMEDLTRSIPGEDLVDPERVTTLRIIAERELLVGVEPPYINHFEAMHARRMEKAASEGNQVARAMVEDKK